MTKPQAFIIFVGLCFLAWDLLRPMKGQSRLSVALYAIAFYSGCLLAALLGMVLAKAFEFSRSGEYLLQSVLIAVAAWIFARNEASRQNREQTLLQPAEQTSTPPSD